MKSRAVTIGVSILLGVLTTGTVAWTLALIERHQTHGSTTARNRISDYSIHNGIEWTLTRFDAAGTQIIVSNRTFWAGRFSKPVPGGKPEQFLPEWCPFDRPLAEFSSRDVSGESRVASAFGWPRPALWSEERTLNSGRTVTQDTRGAWHFPYGFTSTGSRDGYEVLPLRPIWRGALFNVCVYSAAWFGIIVGLSHFRRGRRVARGLCPMCAYNIRGNETSGCPECGWNRK